MIEVIYQITSPTFIEFICEFDISIQNVELYVLQDFSDEDSIEDQELAESFLEIPSPIESTAMRKTSIYLSKPGKYSVFLIDKKLPQIFNLMKEFPSEKPCATLKISHSIQKFSVDKIVESSLQFLSAWPRRLDINDPFFVNSDRNLVITLYPNSLDVDKNLTSMIKFSVIDLDNTKKIYNIEPDKVVVTYPTRRVESKNGLDKFVKEIKIECFFASGTLKDVIGVGRLLLLSDPQLISDSSMMPYYVIYEGQGENLKKIDTGERKAIVAQEDKEGTTQPVKEKLTLKQRRHKLTTSLDVIEECEGKCVNGDCNERGV